MEKAAYLDDGQGEGQGLAHAGACAADQVTPVQDLLQRQRLAASDKHSTRKRREDQEHVMSRTGGRCKNPQVVTWVKGASASHTPTDNYASFLSPLQKPTRSLNID